MPESNILAGSPGEDAQHDQLGDEEQTAKLSIAPDMQLVGQSSTLALHAVSLQVAA